MPKPNAQSGSVEVTPEMYARVFESFAEGALVLEDLLHRYGGNPYVKGGPEGDRATAFKCGENNVVNFIVNQINRASEPKQEEEPES
jgi:hypothetical protein